MPEGGQQQFWKNRRTARFGLLCHLMRNLA
jgi:hypothetical protein